MSGYRRVKIEGGISFFTLALADRGDDLLVRHIERLRSAYASAKRRLPFTTVAICILPDHIHALWQLPDGDADYASRWSWFKSAFSRGLAPAPTRSASKIAKREKGIWQRRYWEHTLRLLRFAAMLLLRWFSMDHRVKPGGDEEENTRART